MANKLPELKLFENFLVVGIEKNVSLKYKTKYYN